MNTYSTHHDGIDRVVGGLDVVKRTVKTVSINRLLPAALLTGAVLWHSWRAMAKAEKRSDALRRDRK